MAEKANEFLLITVTGLLEHIGVLPPAQAQLVLLQRFVAADCFNLGDDDDDNDDDNIMIMMTMTMMFRSGPTTVRPQPVTEQSLMESVAGCNHHHYHQHCHHHNHQ